ncbi:MAG: formate dehydrogenase accessory sulfurtransferase FdhD [Gordonia sp. (in: high G+C Gram-positive bacteria)]
MGRVTARKRVTRVRRGEAAVTRPDTLAVEEPLEIRVTGQPYTVTMRTPGHDVELAAGLLVSEGVLRRTADLITARYCAGATEGGVNTYNILDVTIAEDVEPPRPRARLTTSACGVCGKDSIDAVSVPPAFSAASDPLVVDAATVLDLPDRLRAAQTVFDRTGGLHAAALYDPAADEILVVREDVGRHNAVDKVIGWAVLHDRLPLCGTVLQVSGRAGFELVQKAAAAGVPMLSAVSAPSSLAVELAVAQGITLAGFVRGQSMVLYSRADRVRPEVAS